MGTKNQSYAEVHIGQCNLQFCRNRPSKRKFWVKSYSTRGLGTTHSLGGDVSFYLSSRPSTRSRRRSAYWRGVFLVQRSAFVAELDVRHDLIFTAAAARRYTDDRIDPLRGRTLASDYNYDDRQHGGDDSIYPRNVLTFSGAAVALPLEIKTVCSAGRIVHSLNYWIWIDVTKTEFLPPSTTKRQGGPSSRTPPPTPPLRHSSTPRRQVPSPQLPALPLRETLSSAARLRHCRCWAHRQDGTPRLPSPLALPTYQALRPRSELAQETWKLVARFLQDRQPAPPRGA